MKAWTYDRYGSPDVLRLEDVPVPAAEGADVVVRVRAAAVNPADHHMLRGDPYLIRLDRGLRRPRRVPAVIGSDVAGVVEAVGPDVTRFAVGDEVYGETGGGACAELVRVRQDVLARKPERLSFEQAAAVPLAGLTALQFLRDHGRVRAGQHVLVNGASGGVGHLAVQLAVAMGAEVTGVCSGRNVEMVRRLGASTVVDYTAEDVVARGRRYDVVLDAVGNRNLRDLRRLLVPRGTLLVVGGRGGRLIGPLGLGLRAVLLSPFVGQRLVMSIARANGADVEVLTDYVEQGALTPVVDRVVPFGDVPAAMHHLETGHARGKVVVAGPSS